MLTALRRRLLITTWVIVVTQSLVLALGTAALCVERDHKHAGVAAPDCAMHHRPDLGSGIGIASSSGHHGHHASSASDSDVQISCRCSSDTRQTMLGEGGVLEGPFATSPSFQIARLTVPAAASFLDLVYPPSSPPPRL